MSFSSACPKCSRRVRITRVLTIAPCHGCVVQSHRAGIAGCRHVLEDTGSSIAIQKMESAHLALNPYLHDFVYVVVHPCQLCPYRTWLIL